MHFSNSGVVSDIRLKIAIQLAQNTLSSEGGNLNQGHFVFPSFIIDNAYIDFLFVGYLKQNLPSLSIM